MSTADSGLFGPDSVTWRVHADPVFAVAGLRALLLEALHPLAIAAVAQAGGFAADPWGRLVRTSEYVATITYGTRCEAERAGARVRGVHRRLRAVDPATGRPFRVDRPDLLTWIHCCGVDSLLDTARRGGLRLTDRDADRYVAEQVLAAELVGLPVDRVPRTTVELRSYFDSVRPELACTPDALAAVREIATPPMARWVALLTPARPAWRALHALSLGMLPRWARRMYGLPGLAVTDRAAEQVLHSLRGVALAVPDRWRDGPTLRAARQRVAA